MEVPSEQEVSSALKFVIQAEVAGVVAVDSQADQWDEALMVLEQLYVTFQHSVSVIDGSLKR